MYGIETIKKLNDKAAKRAVPGKKASSAGSPEYEQSHTKEELRELRAQYAHDRAGEVFVIYEERGK